MKIMFKFAAENIEQKAITTTEKAFTSAWDTTKQNVETALKNFFPIAGRQNVLHLNNIEIDDRLDPNHIRSQAEAKDQGKTWGVPVYGEIALKDKAGNEISKSRIKLCTLPKLTPRYSYIVDGGEWQLEKQWRLKSGIYSRIQENGNIQSEFNLLPPGFARESRLYIPFDPESKRYKVKYGTAHIPLYSILKVMGISDDQMKKAWDEDIYKANVSKDYKKDIMKFYNNQLKTRGVVAKDDTFEGVESAIREAMHGAGLLKDTTKITMGKPYDHVDGEALLHASANIRDVAKGTRPPDNIHSLAFKNLLDVEDYIRNKFENKVVQRSLQSKIRNNLDRKSRVSEIISNDLFNKPLKQVFTSNTLSQRPEQVNPLEMLSNRSITTITGEGGLQNERAIRPDMKIIHPTHFGFLDVIHTPESEKTGISLHLPLAVKKIGNEAMTYAYDTHEGKMRYVNPTELHSNGIILPDQVKWGADKKPILPTHPVKIKDPVTHEFVERDAKEARFVLPSAKGLFDDATNLIPFLQNNQGNRTMTASRQATQAVALKDAEAPLVQVQAENPAFTWEKRIGNYFAHKSPIDGHVKEIIKDKNGHPDSIIVSDGHNDHEVELYNHFPLNDAKTHLNARPLVKKGDKVTKGGVLADINYTKNGVLALGSNLHIGYFPYKGLTFEDGLVISETGAKRLSSEHLHKVSIELDPRKDIVSKTKFSAYAQTTAKKLTKEQTAKVEDSGVIKTGVKVKAGDILVAAIGKNEQTGQLAMVGSRLKGAVNPYKDKSLLWDSDYEGEVVKVVRHPNDKNITVYVKTVEPLQVGDKVCGRHGNKGVVGAVIPDHEMPRVGGPDGKPLDLIMNPSGVASRINIGQLMETAASKIALKTGQPYVVNNFGGKGIDYTQKIENDLKKHNLKDTDKIYDPVTKKFLTQEVLAGHQYIMKLKHQAEKKLSVRSMSVNSYGVNQEPKGGGDQGSQSLGHLELYALLASGARHNLKEISSYKAERQHDEQLAGTDFWNRVMLGQPLPPPKPTFAYRKFEGLMMGLGLNIKKDGYKHTLIPMTDADILKQSKGEIKDAGIMRGKNEKEINQGLFDPKVTGGLPNAEGKGLFWSHFKLAEPVPNPIFVGTGKMPGPAVLLTGLKFDDFEAIAKGEKEINGKVGGEAIKHMLSKINVDEELKKTKALLPKLKGAELNQANRKARYLMALKETGLRPEEAYVLHNIPIVPPVYRPVTPMDNGQVIFSDINHLYSHLIQVSNALKIKKNQPEIPEEEKVRYRAALYDKMKAIAGLGNVPIYDGSRKLKGIIQTIAGDNPKVGFFQSKIMKRRQELSMRGAITPEPAMQIDQVGLPKNAAMSLYKPFVIRELMKMGRDVLDAAKEVKEGTPIAWRALDRAVADRPVLLKRDPVLHKYNIQAFTPKLVDGNSVKLHPLVCGSFNADFDGDTMAAYLPITEDARKEALEKLLPSKNLFSATHFGVMHAPDQEAVLGIHLLTNWGKKTGLNYKSAEDIMKDNNLHISDVVLLNGKETTKGRQVLAEKLPHEFKTNDMLYSPSYTLKKGSIHSLLEDLAKHDPKSYPQIVNHLKDLGNKYSTDEGFSFRLSDLHPLKEKRDEILKPYNEEARKVNMSSISQEKKDERLVDIYSKATKELDDKLHPEYRKMDNNIFKMVDTKARGSAASFRQMNIAPMLMKDALNKTIPTPILRSYSEGLDIGDYWTTLHGARKGTLQRVEGTSEPGKLTKEVVNLNISTLITKHDCDDKHGISMAIHRPDGKEEEDINDRILSKPLMLGTKHYDAGTVITPELFNEIKLHKLSHVNVRSPLTCKETDGLCAKCFGLNENGKFHEIGTNIGILASQALGEPATQLAMDSFHSGGVAASRGGGSVDKFTRLDQLLNIPKILPGAAVLSKKNGTITKIVHDPSVNGHYIHIDAEKHFVPSQRIMNVKVGDVVERGEKLTDGNINPRQLLPLKGIDAVKHYLTGALKNEIYKDDTDIRRKNIEVVVRNLTNMTAIKDPGDSQYMTGDKVHLSHVNDFNSKIGPHQNPIKHEPLIEGISQAAEHKDEDYLSRFNFRQIKQNLLQGASQSWSTHAHGLNPVGPYAMSTISADKLPGY